MVARTRDDVKPSISRTLFAGLAGGCSLLGRDIRDLRPDRVGSGPAQWSALRPRRAEPKVPGGLDRVGAPGHYSQPRRIWCSSPTSCTGPAAPSSSGQSPRTGRPVSDRGVWSLAAVIWGLSCAFFELLGPVNLLGEPLGLVAVELGFWAVAAIAEAIVLVFAVRHPWGEELAAIATPTTDSRPDGPAVEVAGEALPGAQRSATPLFFCAAPGHCAGLVFRLLENAPRHSRDLRL